MFLHANLFSGATPQIDTTFCDVRRSSLDERSWVDVARGWLNGADGVFYALSASLAWRQRTVTMYDRRLPEPRLSAWWSQSGSVGAEPLAVLGTARRALSDRYQRNFDSIGFNWYRDGRDSVAWHGDRFAKHVTDPTVAIVSVGAARAFRLRPRSGGRSLSFDVGYGDLLVMGGACQHEWQHSIQKAKHVAGPRISITFRHHAEYPKPVLCQEARAHSARIRT